jgi:hypothetical protein
MADSQDEASDEIPFPVAQEKTLLKSVSGVARLFPSLANPLSTFSGLPGWSAREGEGEGEGASPLFFSRLHYYRLGIDWPWQFPGADADQRTSILVAAEIQARL